MDQSRKDKLRLYILGDKTDQSADDLIEQICTDIEKRLVAKLNRLKRLSRPDEEPYLNLPIDLEWIADELTVRRYNRLGSEGYSSQSVEGHSVSFFNADELEEYTSELLAFLSPEEDRNGGRPGRVVIF